MRIKVGTYNIRFENEEDGPDQWKYRKKELLKQIERNGFDVIGLQEVVSNQFKDLKKLKKYQAVGKSRDGEGHEEYNPILYRKDKFKCVQQATLWLSKTPFKVSKDWNSACYRICTWVLLECLETQERFVFMNAHIDHESLEAQINQVKILEEITDVEYPIILVGDFNVEKENKILRPLHSRFNYIKPMQNHGTFNDFRLDPEKDELEHIDHIFVSKNIDCDSLTICTEKTRKGRYLSDHFLLTTEANIPHTVSKIV